MRKVTEIIKAQAASDGAGVRLLRVFGGRGPERFDPFLMLDEFGSPEASDYIGGFPPHPHRGFETITYMLEGKMEHRDHLDNVGLLSDGDVQWMTAARGIIHSEMPRQTEGRMRGFQLWLNLHAEDKMKPASYRDVPSTEIPVFDSEGLWIKAIAGEGQVNGRAYSGLILGKKTQPHLWDMALSQPKSAAVVLPDGLNVMVYVYEGEVEIDSVKVRHQHLARLSGDGEVHIKALVGQARFLLIGGRPIKEPIVQYGPFVMNTTEEIERAVQEFRDGTFT